MDWQDFPDAPPTGTILPIKGNEIVDGAVRCASIGDFNLILARQGGRLVGYVNACPHQFLPLNHRSDAILSTCGQVLRCSNHSAGFRLADGCGSEGLGIGSNLIRVPVGARGDSILLGVEDEPE